MTVDHDCDAQQKLVEAGVGKELSSALALKCVHEPQGQESEDRDLPISLALKRHL